MPPELATIIVAFVIPGLFWLDRDRKATTSKALWIPGVWLWIVGTRELSKWLAMFGIGQASTSELEGSPLDRNLYTVLLVLGIIVLARRGREVERLLRANTPIILFFLYCAASVAWSDYPGVSFKRWIKALGDPVMVMIVLTDPDRLAAIKRLLTRTTFLIVPLSILVIKYYPAIGVQYRSAEGKRVITGLTDDKNAVGGLCLILGVACLWRFLSAYQEPKGARRGRHLAVHGTVLMMVLWLFSKANSMTSLLCFVLASGLIVAISVFGLARKRAAVSLMLVTMLAVVPLVLFFNIGGSLLETVGRDASLTGRTDIWKEALAKVTNPIGGTGFESFWLNAPLDGPQTGRWWHVNEAHNGYLEVYLNLGLVGLALLAIVIIKGHQNIISVLSRDTSEGGLLLAYFLIELTYCFTEAGFRMMSLTWICFLLATIALPERFSPNASPARQLVASDAIRKRFLLRNRSGSGCCGG